MPRDGCSYLASTGRLEVDIAGSEVVVAVAVVVAGEVCGVHQSGPGGVWWCQGRMRGIWCESKTYLRTTGRKVQGDILYDEIWGRCLVYEGGRAGGAPDILVERWGVNDPRRHTWSCGCATGVLCRVSLSLPATNAPATVRIPLGSAMEGRSRSRNAVQEKSSDRRVESRRIEREELECCCCWRAHC